MRMERTLYQKQQLRNRKTVEWSKVMIHKLIALYKKHECLWNHRHESYKNRDERNRAMQHICNTMQVSKFECSKKIHTLRNQLNAQMRKLEILQKDGEPIITSELRSKWRYFESLMFLSHDIERRPENFQPSFQKIRLICDFNNKEEDIDASDEMTNNSNSANTTNDEEGLSQFESVENTTDEVITGDFQSFENDCEKVCDQECRPSESFKQAVTSHNFLATENNKKLQKTSCSSPSFQTEIGINHNSENELKISNLAADSSHMAIKTTTTSLPSISTPVITSITSGGYSNRSTFVLQDEWDAFGVLVANEFRNLNSELSRKILKRKIMQAMLEVGEIDDNSIPNHTNSI